jgi:uncharacterized membrane protein YcaP (DUF421 family)
MDPFRIVVRVVCAYVWALVLVRISGHRTIQQADVQSFILAVVLGDMFDDMFWAEVSAAQFATGAGTLVLTHIWARATNAGSGGRIWRREVSQAPR